MPVAQRGKEGRGRGLTALGGRERYRCRLHRRRRLRSVVGYRNLDGLNDGLSWNAPLIAVPLGYGRSEKADESTVSGPVA